MDNYDDISRDYARYPDMTLEEDIMRAFTMLRGLVETEMPGTYSSDGLLTAACALVARAPVARKPLEVMP